MKKTFKTVLSILFLIIYTTFPVHATSGQEMTVHFLDVSQGLSILVQSDGQTLLYDGGDRSHSSFVVSYLQNQKIDSIDYLISSHYDEDHVSGLIGCLNTFPVSHVIASDYTHGTNLYDSFMDAVDAQGIEIEYPEPGETYSLGSGEFTILAPSVIHDDSNNNSVAIRLTNGADSFVFTGDAAHESEEEMINTGLTLDCDVLSIGHHGSANSTSWDFLEATLPEYAVISCGAGNQYGHPDADVMEKLLSMEIEIYRTDIQGTIIAESNGSGITWSAPPCNDYTPGEPNDTGTQPQSAPEGNANTQTLSDNELAASQEQGQAAETAPQEQTVWLSATGSKYHSIPNCGNMNPDKARQVSVDEAIAQGYEVCKKCF